NGPLLLGSGFRPPRPRTSRSMSRIDCSRQPKRPSGSESRPAGSIDTRTSCHSLGGFLARCSDFPRPAFAVTSMARDADERDWKMKAWGTGSLYRRSGGVWWIQYSYRGKVYRESSRSTVRAEATRLLRKRQSEMARGRLVGREPERVTFNDLVALIRAD